MNPFLSFSPFFKFSIKQKGFLTFCLMLFFWTLFEGSFEYVFPLKITQSGYSETFLGLLIASSSLFGAFFDIYLSNYFSNTNFRRISLLMLALSLVFPLLVWKGIILFYLFAMVLWGISYDLSHFVAYDFVGREVAPENHSKQFGIIEMFKALGFIISPLIIALTISNIISWQPFMLMIIFLFFGIAFYLLLLKFTKQKKEEYAHEKPKHLYLLREFGIWKTLGKRLVSILLLTLLFHMFDGFVWTIGPILAESFTQLHPFNGLFLTLYSLPPLFTGWFIGKITQKLGKKKTAFTSFIIGALLLSIFSILHNALILLVLIFFVGFFTSIALPAMEGAYADYISETAQVEKEIESVIDFFTNLGFILGPITAGLLADMFGNAQAFSLMGVICAWLAFLLWQITPKHINIRIGKTLLAEA